VTAPARNALATIALAAGMTVLCCLEPSPPLPQGYGGESGVATTTISTTVGPVATASSSTGGGPCLPQPTPDYVPSGWMELTTWSCDCRLWVPTSPLQMPAPIAWESCPETPDGLECRMMVIDWRRDNVPVGWHARMTTDDDGLPILAFVRVGIQPDNGLIMAYADGPVLSAVVAEHGSGCLFHNSCLIEGKWLSGVRGHDAHEAPSKHQGAIGGAVDSFVPQVLAHTVDYENPFTDGWSCSGKWVARLTWPFVMTVFPWDESQVIEVTSSATDPQGMDMSQLTMVGNALFWTTANASKSGINVWDPNAGTRLFRRWVDDPSRGAGNLGTDGVDLVWCYGEGKGPGDEHFPVRSIMTAPFTTDPDVVARTERRLRSQPDYPVQVNEWVVGCGYAARDTNNKVFVVRLSDGWAWYLPSTPTQFIGRPIGLTCDEVFFFGKVNGVHNIMRVRLDSLGPGLPPD
jgi:hypothetical protein